MSKLKAYAVGTDGDFNWQAIYAENEEQAKYDWMKENTEYGDPMVERHPAWDKKKVVAGDNTWFREGLGTICSKCGYETFIETGGKITRKGILCGDCYADRNLKRITP
jgi:formylmethanofuran dehydrogenase subunit E